MIQPAWLTQAAALPVAFAQVREDPLLDETLVAQAGHKARICMVASGGCTAAALATLPSVELLHCVDPNPAQLALARVKLALLRDAPIAQRMLALGHTTALPEARAPVIRQALHRLQLSEDVFGPPSLLAQSGLDHIGRYELLFAALRAELLPQNAALQHLLAKTEPALQRQLICVESPLWRALEQAFHTVMALPNLIALFGESATRNPQEAFSQHFLRRLRWVLETLPARTNPFVTQLLLGRFSADSVHRWITLPELQHLPAIEWECSFMVPALLRAPAAFDLVHLSNILDWLSPDEARTTLSAAHAALRPGGRVIVRQLNSSLNIPALGGSFAWDASAGAALLARDRSFFYRHILVGRAR